MKFQSKNLFYFFYRFIGTIACVAGLTFVFTIFKSYLAVQYIALFYLLPVMISTVLWGLTPGILAAFLSFLAFNYFFIKPYNTLLVHQTQDVITLFIFLIIAFVMSQLIGQAKTAAQQAKDHEWEATRMYQFIAALAGATDTANLAQIIAAQTHETFSFSKVEVRVNSWMDEPEIKRSVPEDVIPIKQPSEKIPMSTVRESEGEILIWYDNQPFLSEKERRLLETFSNQSALAIERIHLLKRENKTRVLEESDRIKTSLLNSVSHELRSPLAAIKASVSSLRIGAVDWNSDAREELLATVEEETDRLNSLVGNLLDMSRIEAGSLNPQKKWNSIQEIVMSAAAKMRNQLQMHKLKYNFSEALPLLPTDFVLMEQVFMNLLSNSIKYSPENTEISISAEERGELEFIEVENKSPHIPEKYLEHIFDKFFRYTQADKITGTGLGLSICKGIIEAHGGKIWAENRTSGFAFCFTLPRTLNGMLPDTPKDI